MHLDFKQWLLVFLLDPTFGDAEKWKWTLVIQSCPTLCSPMGCSPAGPLSMEFSGQEYWSGLPFPSPGNLPRDWTQVSCIAGRFFTNWATREAWWYRVLLFFCWPIMIQWYQVGNSYRTTSVKDVYWFWQSVATYKIKDNYNCKP